MVVKRKPSANLLTINRELRVQSFNKPKQAGNMKSNNNERKGFSTKSVHAGEKTDSLGSVVTPIYETSVFAFSKTKELLEVIKHEKPGYIYTRWDNPTVRAVEKKMAELEKTEDAAVFSSGMAAITTAVLSLVASGDHIVATKDLYGGTLQFFKEVLPKFGVKVSLMNVTDLDKIAPKVQRNTKVFFAETPTNPTLRIADLSQIADLAKKNKTCELTTMIDSTLASPFNLKPAEFGIDLVVHSATKYLGGHNDVTAGVVCGDEEAVSKIKNLRKILGGTLDPFAAWLLLRGLKTLGLRMERHNSNAMEVAKFLLKHPKIKHVNYPGLNSHPQHLTAKKQMKGFGGVVSFEIRGDLKKTMQFVESLKLCALGASLGGAETLVTQPVTASHYFISANDRKEAGITDQLVRLALGIEDSNDIIADLEQALKKV
jgi:cystathionine beta-lyase/cystathionine gamma-synthase